MNLTEQFEPRDLEFQPDWTGLEFVGFVAGSRQVSDPTDRDCEEFEVWIENDEVNIPLTVHPRQRIPFDFMRCYQLAEAGCNSTEVAVSMGIPVHVVTNNIRARYGVGWRDYSDRARMALNGEIRRKLIEAIRKGNDKILVLYAQKFLTGWDAPEKLELTGADGGPIQTQTLLVTIPTEELMKKKAQLQAIVDKQPRFLRAPTDNTLEVVPGGQL